MLRMTCLFVFGLAAALMPLGCGGSEEPGEAGLQGTITIAGSSTAGPITEAVIEEFQADFPAVNLTNSTIGTGGGFKRFTIGETEISNASRPIKPSEAEAAASNSIEFIELPIAYDGLTIVVSQKNDFAYDLTLDELKLIFRAGSEVTTWADVREGWANKEIKFFTPGTDSGTYDYFLEVVGGEAKELRKGMAVSENDNVLVNNVAADPYALGFFGCAYYFASQDKLRSLGISPAEGVDPIRPTHDTIETGEYAPFSRPLFIYVNAQAADRPDVAAFVEFYMRNGGRIAEKIGYVQLPREYYLSAFERFRSRETGTRYVDEAGESVYPTLQSQFE